MRSRARRLMLAGAAVAVTALVATIGLASHSDDKVDCKRFRFDSVAWKSQSLSFDYEHPRRRTVRQRLADGLLECGTLEGMTPGEVTRLLGPSESPPSSPGWEWATGPQRSDFATDPEYLTIAFRAGRVARVDLGP